MSTRPTLHRGPRSSTRSDVARLLARCGAVGLVATGALAIVLAARPAQALDEHEAQLAMADPKAQAEPPPPPPATEEEKAKREAEKQKPGDPSAAPSSTEDYIRRLREEAEKRGLNVPSSLQTPPASTPAQPGVGPAPTPATPQPGAQPAQPGAQPAQPGAQPAQPGTQPGAQPNQPHTNGKGALPGNGARPKPGGPPTTRAAAPNATPTPGAVPGAVPPGVAAGAQPAAPGNLNLNAPDPSAALVGDTFTLTFVEPIELVELVRFVRDAFNLQVIFMDGGLKGQQVLLGSPITLRKDQVIPFVISLLEQREYTMVQDPDTNIFYVAPKGQMPPTPIGGRFSTTRVIRTPNIKPSSLQGAVNTIIGQARGTPTPGGAPMASQPIFLDDLGLIILSDSPRVTTAVEEFVNRVVKERTELKFTRYELQNISAASARDRVLELLGQQQQRSFTSAQPGAPVQPQQVPQVSPLGGLGTIGNLNERITIDPTSNALYFRGRPDEQQHVAELLRLVDVPNTMVSRWYPVGIKTAEAVANAGSAEQLGAITSFESSEGRTGGGLGVARTNLANQGLPGQPSAAGLAGAGFVLYPESGGFIYRGTESQQRRVEDLVRSLAVISTDEAPVYEFYKLRHGKSTDVAEVIQNLLSNTAPTANRGGLLGRDIGSRGGSGNTPRAPRGTQVAGQPGTPGNPANPNANPNNDANSLAGLEGADVFVLADEPNNQILVKAPRKLQPQFRQLISRIDLRRPQVYIDAKIVAVSSSDDFRLAVEAQQIIGQFAFNTNFGLSTLGTSTTTGGTTTTSGTLLDRKNPVTNLSGFTSALIRSKDVPFVVNALARDIDTRIVATPQLLVDDNEEAEVSSVDQQPTATTTTSSNGPPVQSFGGFEEAGPKLKVKPQISEGGYLRLEYEIELSSFQGSASGSLPPPKQKNNIKSASVTVPTDTTIVVGGLTFQQNGRTIIKVPLLGDIPILGNLFRDQSTTKRNTTLYIFMTPKIMRDPSFADLRLLTRAPLAEAKLPSEFPPAVAERIDVVDAAREGTARRQEEEIKKHKRDDPEPPTKGAPVRREIPRDD